MEPLKKNLPVKALWEEGMQRPIFILESYQIYIALVCSYASKVERENGFLPIWKGKPESVRMLLIEALVPPGQLVEYKAFAFVSDFPGFLNCSDNSAAYKLQCMQICSFLQFLQLEK